jgi:tRNA(adenine34) deaminase
MTAALAAAVEAGERGEVPVGAVVVRHDRLLSIAGNASIAGHDPAGHAEVVALRTAARVVGNYRLTGATLYVTVEPCLMCVGAALHARVERLVFGCADPKGGAAGSLYDVTNDPRLNHRIAVVSCVEEAACRTLLQQFFRARRKTRAAR